MNDRKPKPAAKSKRVELREPAKPITQPDAKPLPADHPMYGIVGPVLEAAIPTTHQPPTGQPPPTSQPIAPTRDFARVPNSVALKAIPSRIFRGESLKTYQALYQRTRAAIVPRRSVRATRAEIMEWAGVSHNTLKLHQRHLETAGLLKVHFKRGDNDGAEWEVFTPEEAGLPPTTHHPLTTHPPEISQNLGRPTSQNLVIGGGGQVAEESATSGEDKTSFKTKDQNTDDEAFADFVSIFNQLTRDLTGKKATKADAARWRELADVIVAEARIAAGRTTISSVPAFLAEHLRRRLFKKDKAQLEAEVGSASTTKSEKGSDASKCPDCFGAGMYYPEGFEKGVAKCTHPQLTVTDS